MWFKVDDKLWGSPKWLALNSGPRALWVSAGAWSGDQLTDGFVPSYVLPVLGGSRKDAGSLVAVGLWENAEGGFNFHDWADYQVSRDAVMTKRDAESQRKADWRAKKASERESAASHAPVPDVSQRDNRVRPDLVTDVSRSTRPDPTRPDQTLTPKGVSTHTAPAAPRPVSEPAGFLDFWAVYPKRADKGHARTAYATAARTTSVEDILTGAQRLAADPNLPEAKFIPNASTWLRGERWDDGPLPSRNGRPPDRQADLLRSEMVKAQAADALTQRLEIGA